VSCDHPYGEDLSFKKDEIQTTGFIFYYCYTNFLSRELFCSFYGFDFIDPKTRMSRIFG